MTNKYKCTDHHLNVVCLGCMAASINRYEKLLEFIKKIERTDSHKIRNDFDAGFACYADKLAEKAEELLKEIGEYNV